MSRSSSSSPSQQRSSESEDHTSNTSYTSNDNGSKDKGKERAHEYEVQPGPGHVGIVRAGSGSESRGRRNRYPLSGPGPTHDNLHGPSTSYSPAYPLSPDESDTKPHRRLSLGVNVRRTRILQLVLALSIPVLGLLLANEIRINNHRTRLHENAPPERRTTEWEAMDVDVRPQTLAEMRKGYEKKRRKDLAKRSGPGLPVPFWPTPDKDHDEQGFVEDVKGWWPEWWGDRDQVGPSPYDHTPVPAHSEKKRLLFLTSYNDYLDRMNTHTYEIVDAALRHPGIITDVWGPGWKGYNSDLTLSVNVQRRARRIEDLERSKAEYDKRLRHDTKKRAKEIKRRATWAKWTLGSVNLVLLEEAQVEPWTPPEWRADYEEGCGPVKWEAVWTISDIFKQHDKHLDALACGALLVQQLGDCHEFRCFKEWYPQANNITLSKYAFELEEIFSYDRVKAAYPDWQMGIFGHNPDTGNEWDFYPGKWQDKVHDATMFGFDGSFYPIRTTITDRHHAHNNDHSIPEPLVKHHRHPGYNVATDRTLKDDPMETYIPGHWSYENHRRLREDFAQGMRNARICVFDSSLERKMIRKYAQALLSGCVVAGDIPTEHEDGLSKFMIHLHPSWKIDRIEEELRSYLADPERLEQMALDGFIYARRYLTSTRKIDHVMAMANAYRSGVRGYEYPYGFSLRCRTYWGNDRAYRPPWCDQTSLRGLEA